MDMGHESRVHVDIVAVAAVVGVARSRNRHCTESECALDLEQNSEI